MYEKSDCFDLNLKYFLGSECKDNCYGFYQIELEENLNKYIKCFESLDEALSDDNVKFCDISQKNVGKNFLMMIHIISIQYLVILIQNTN